MLQKMSKFSLLLCLMFEKEHSDEGGCKLRYDLPQTGARQALTLVQRDLSHKSLRDYR